MLRDKERALRWGLLARVPFYELFAPPPKQASALSSTDLEICSISAFLRDGQNVVSSVHLFLETSSLCQQELWEMQHRYSNYK